MHDTDEHHFDVRQAHDMRMEYIPKKRQHCIFTRTIGGWNTYEKQLAEGISKKLEEMKSRYHMNMQPISLYQVKSVSS